MLRDKKGRIIRLPRPTLICKYCKKKYEIVPWLKKKSKYCTFKCAMKGAAFDRRGKPSKKRTSSKIEKQVIKAYKNGEDLSRIKEKYSIANTTLYRILKRNNVKTSDFIELRVNIVKARKCIGCGKLFTPPQNDRHYCNKACYLKNGIKQYNTGRTHFKKGSKPWNKNKKWSEVLSPERYKDFIRKDREHIIEQYKKGDFPRQANTDIERMLTKELRKRGHKDFVQQFNLYGKFACDFVFPKQKLIIECDGDWHHANPKKYKNKKLHPIQEKTIKKDKAKNAYIKKIDGGSWTLLRFWGSDIKKDVSKCVDKIEAFL